MIILISATSESSAV